MNVVSHVVIVNWKSCLQAQTTNEEPPIRSSLKRFYTAVLFLRQGSHEDERLEVKLENNGCETQHEVGRNTRTRFYLQSCATLSLILWCCGDRRCFLGVLIITWHQIIITLVAVEALLLPIIRFRVMTKVSILNASWDITVYSTISSLHAL